MVSPDDMFEPDDDSDAAELDAEIDRIFREYPTPFDRLPGEVYEEPLTNGSARSPNGTFRERKGRSFSRSDPQAVEERARVVRQLLSRAASGDAGTALRAVKHLRVQIEALELDAVVLARSWGWTWRDVARVLGVATQTVHRRYANEDDRPRMRRKRG